MNRNNGTNKTRGVFAAKFIWDAEDGSQLGELPATDIASLGRPTRHAQGLLRHNREWRRGGCTAVKQAADREGEWPWQSHLVVIIDILRLYIHLSYPTDHINN